MDNPAKKIIEKIKAEHIAPEAKWKINWKNYLFWLSWIGTLILGALSFSLIILNFLDLEPGTFRHIRLGKFMFLMMMTAPYLWILLAVLALVSGFLAIRRTKRGYRYSVLFATSLSVLIVSILGVTFHMARLNEKVGRKIPPGIPHEFAFPIEGRWNRPGENMLGGKVLVVEPEKFLLEDFREGEWEVYYYSDTEMKLKKPLEAGIMVGIFGETMGEKKFKAKFIRSLTPFLKQLINDRRLALH